MRLRYVYLEGRPDSPTRMGTGILIMMDVNKVAFVKTASGRWVDERWAHHDDPIDYTQRTVNDLIRKGWVIGTAWDERGNPVRVERTEKPGTDALSRL